MIVAAKHFILACVLISCANKIHTSPKTKFSFTKTFLTPRELHEKRNEELDKCEILERSNFSSDEDDDKEDQVVKSKDDVSKVVANAHIHVRFGGEAEEPTARNEKFIEMPRNKPINSEWFYQPTKVKEMCSNQPIPHPPSAYHYYSPPVFPPYNPYYHFGPIGYPYGHIHGSYPPYLPTMRWPCPYHPCHRNSNCTRCLSQNHNQTCITSKPTQKPKCNVTEVPFIYFFTRDRDGEIPSPEQIKKQPTEELTNEHLKLIDKFLDIDESSEEANCKIKECVFDDEPTSTSTTCSPKPTQCNSTEKPSSCNDSCIPDIVLTHANCSCKCNNKDVRCGSIHDMDDIVRLKGSPICDSNKRFWSPYHPPCGGPRYMNFFPWMSDFQRMYWNPWGYHKSLSSVSNPQFYGYGKPAQPPFALPGGF